MEQLNNFHLFSTKRNLTFFNVEEKNEEFYALRTGKGREKESPQDRGFVGWQDAPLVA